MCNKPNYYLEPCNIPNATADYLMTKFIHLDTHNLSLQVLYCFFSVLEYSFPSEDALHMDIGH